jgi:hypothetical protein
MLGMAVACSEAAGDRSIYFTDIFSREELGERGSWERDGGASWSSSESPGHLRMDTTQDGSLFRSGPPPRNLLLSAILSEDDFGIDVQLLFWATANDPDAGIVIYEDADNDILFEREFCDHYATGCVGDAIDTIHDTRGEPQAPSLPFIPREQDDVYHRVMKTGTSYEFFASGGGSLWMRVGEKTNVLPRVCAVGLFAESGGQDVPAIPADFDYFHLIPAQWSQRECEAAGTTLRCTQARTASGGKEEGNAQARMGVGVRCGTLCAAAVGE